ncbi:MAG: SIMPL domain-containing protein [Pseudomonadota bacterium]
MKHIFSKSLAAALLLAVLPHAAEAEERGPDYDMISLQADARAEVPNDLLVATLFVEMTQSDATKLAADVTKALNNGIRLVHDFPGVKIESGQQSTWPVYDAKNKLTGWRTRAELRVESKDFDAAAKAIAKLQSGMQMGALTFVLSPDTADSTSNRLIDSALKAFRARADIVAKSMGAKGWRPVNLNIGTDGGYHPPMPMYRKGGMVAMAADAVPEQEMAGGNSNLTVTVSGTVQLLR